MSDTPRSDVIEKSDKEVYVGYAYTSALELARDLERENADLRNRIIRMEKALEDAVELAELVDQAKVLLDAGVAIEPTSLYHKTLQTRTPRRAG